MKLLAIETSTDACSCALIMGTRTWSAHLLAPRQHARILLPMVGDLVADAGLELTALDGLAFGCGPGSFTGVRIAASVVQGLGVGLGLPVVAVSSLQVLAQGVHRRHGESHVLAAFDARMGEVYWGCYAATDGSGLVAGGDDALSEPEAVSLRGRDGDWAGAGSAWRAHAEVLDAQLAGRVHARFPDAEPDALDLAALASARLASGGAFPALEALPTYLRDRVANVRAKHLDRGT